MWQTRQHKIEMRLLKIDILGMSEIVLKDEEEFRSDNYRLIYSGDKNKNTGVGIILTKEWGQRVKNYLLTITELCFLNIKQTKKPVIIQTYMPTSGYKDEEVEEVYEQL